MARKISYIQSRVREVELGRLGQALDGVGPQRAQQPHHAGGPQDGQPALRRLGVDPGVPGEVAAVDEPARARGAGHEEAVEALLVLDPDKISSV